MSTDEIAKAALAEVLASPKWRDMAGLDADTMYGELAIDVAKAALRREWQSMDTAPRDESEVLIWTGVSMRVANWAYDDKFQAEGLPATEADNWQPLPSPPEDGK